MKISITLSVRVRNHIHRNSINENREIGSVIGVKSAEEDLFRLSSACMLRDKQSGNKTKQVLG